MEEENKESKEESIRELLKQVRYNQVKLESEKKVKGWKIPFKGRVNKAKAAKGYATFQIIRNNGVIDFIKAPIEDGTARIDGFPRIATIDYKLTYKNSPYFIIPEWSMKPFSPVEHKEETERIKMDMIGRKLILSKLEGEQIKTKAKMDGKVIGWVILIGVIGVGAWYLLKGGKLF